ncbi:MAG: glycosyltransferase family 39 protein [Pseudomonadota bacterium]
MKLFIILMLLGLALLAFGAGLSNPFLFDDQVVIVKNEWLRWMYLPNFFRSFIQDSSLGFPGYRPLVMASFLVQREIFGAAPLSFRLVNLFLHVVASFLIFLLARDFFHRWMKRDLPLPAFCVAALFLLHPVQTNVVTLVWKRTDLLVSLGLLGAFFCAGRWVERKGSSAWLLGAYLSSALALLSKESAMILPFLILLGDAAIWRNGRSLSSRLLALYAPTILLSLFLAWLVFLEMPFRLHGVLHITQSFAPPSQLLNRHDYLLTQSVCFLEYLKLLFVPAALNVFHHVTPVRGFGDLRFFPGLMILGLFIWALVRSRANHPWIAFSIAWFLLTLLPSSSLVPLQLSFDEDRLYLPMFGFSLGLIGAGWRLYADTEGKARARIRRLLLWVPIVMCLLYLPLDILRMRVWADDLRLWRMNARDEPQDARAWVNLGIAWGNHGQFRESVAAYRTALTLEPDYGAAHYFFGRTLLDFGRNTQARDELGLAFRAGVFPHDVLGSLALTSLADHDAGAAARSFLWSLRIVPNQAMNLRNLGKLLDDEGQGTAAKAALARATAAEPWNPENKVRLAYLLWKYDRQSVLASDLLRDALRARPEDAQAQTLLEEIRKAPRQLDRSGRNL